MRSTARLLSSSGFQGILRQSLDEFKRGSIAAIKLEALDAPQNAVGIFDFLQPGSIDNCVQLSDGDIGGFSTVNLEFVPETASEPAHARFFGNISNKLPDNNEEVERTGYAAWRTREKSPTLWGSSYWNFDRHRFLALRVKCDHRKYKVNIQTESIVKEDLHQHRLYPRYPGNWETVVIRINEFVRTNRGMLTEPQSEMLTDKIRTFGIGLTDRRPGPFEMCISQLWMTNGLTDEDRHGPPRDDSRHNNKPSPMDG